MGCLDGVLLAGRRYKVPHTLLLSADEERHAVFTAKGHPVHGGAVRIRGTWRSCNEGQQVELTMVERELMDQNETAVTTESHTLSKSGGEGGFGMNIDEHCTIVDYTEPEPSAELQAIAKGSVIVAINSVGVATKDEVVAQLITVEKSAVFTVKPPKTSQRSAVDMVLTLSKQVDESELRQLVGGRSVPNPFGSVRRVLMCQAARVDGAEVAAGAELPVSDHYAWPRVMYEDRRV